MEQSDEYRIQMGESPLLPKEAFIEIPEELRILTDNFSMSFEKFRPGKIKFKTEF